ncbi:MAG: hypothetical protein K2J77_12670 [Oscillospiraceae bacterium]|nr:hypothetical protein [Oscillospiraceae bacterium]
MSKKFIIIAGIVALAALAAAAVTLILLRKKDILEDLDLDDEDVLL